MLDPKLIRQDLEAIATQLKHRGITLDVPYVPALEEQRKTLQTRLQDLQNDRNVRSKAIGQAKAKGENVDPLFQELKKLNDSLKITEEQFTQNSN